MTESNCHSCRRPKSTLNCGVCLESLCKGCAQFLGEATFSFLNEVSANLKHTYYCSSCYDTHVEPELQSYNAILEQARSMYFFFDTQRRPIYALKRSLEPARVDGCEDRDETILRLAFQAAKQGFNSIIEAKVISKKVRNEGYQKTLWIGSGIPANIDIQKFERADAREQ